MSEHRITVLEKDVSEFKVDVKEYKRDNEKWKRNIEVREGNTEKRVYLMEKNMKDIRGLLIFIRNSVITIIVGGFFALLMSMGGG